MTDTEQMLRLKPDAPRLAQVCKTHVERTKEEVGFCFPANSEPSLGVYIMILNETIPRYYWKTYMTSSLNLMYQILEEAGVSLQTGRLFMKLWIEMI